jgi:hypothetical protein
LRSGRLDPGEGSAPAESGLANSMGSNQQMRIVFVSKDKLRHKHQQKHQSVYPNWGFLNVIYDDILGINQ